MSAPVVIKVIAENLTDEARALESDARLTATNAEGQETLSTTVRVGRRAGVTVLATEAGVLLELAPNGHLQINATDYRRVPAGG